MLISILNYLDYIKTEECVNNLLKLPCLKNIDKDIVIVDNDSPNDSYERLLDYYNNNDVIILKTKHNLGYSYGNNFALKYQRKKNIKYEYFCVINPDVKITQDIFTPLIKELDDNSSIGIISTFIHENKVLNYRSQGWKIPSPFEFCTRSLVMNYDNKPYKSYNTYKKGLLEVQVIPGSFFIIRTSVFRNIGYFDENMFMYNEEIVLGMKLKKIGVLSVIDSTLYYEHNHPKYTKKEVYEHYRNNFSKIKKMYNINYQSKNYVCRTYYKKRGLILLKTVNIINYILLYGKHLLSFVYR